MTPRSFPQQTIVWGGKDYKNLPAYTDAEVTISCWSLTWRERLRILFGASLWLHQLNFGRPLQPQRLSLNDPFVGSGSL